MARPLVSIGIPTYNRPLELQRALTSIIGQTYPHFEVIVSDNCSPGRDTHEVVAHFMAQDARIRYVRQPSNIGMFHNFKVVFEMAQGGYFAWLADDDIRDVTFLEKCLAIFEQPHQSSDLLLVNTYSQLMPPERHDKQTSLCSAHENRVHHNTLYRQEQDGHIRRSPLSRLPSTPMHPGNPMQQTDQGCTTLGLSPSERYYKYLSSIYTTQNAIGDLIHGVMKRDAVQQVLTEQKNILGWDRVFLSALALEGEFYTIPEVLMYSAPGGMSTMKNAQKMADIQGIRNSFYIRKAKWVRLFFIQRLAWCSQKLSLLSKLRLSLWLWIDMLTRTVFKREGQ